MTHWLMHRDRNVGRFLEIIGSSFYMLTNHMCMYILPCGYLVLSPSIISSLATMLSNCSKQSATTVIFSFPSAHLITHTIPISNYVIGEKSLPGQICVDMCIRAGNSKILI